MTLDGLYGLVSLEMYQSGPSWRPANDEVMSTWSNIVVAVFAVVAVVTVMAYLYHLHSNNRSLIYASLHNLCKYSPTYCLIDSIQIVSCTTCTPGGFLQDQFMVIYAN